MKTNTTVFNSPKSLKFNVSDHESAYKGYLLVSTVLHYGMGGSLWLTTVVDPEGHVSASFQDEAYCVAEKEAKNFIDNDIDIKSLQYENNIWKSINIEGNQCISFIKNAFTK